MLDNVTRFEREFAERTLGPEAPPHEGSFSASDRSAAIKRQLVRLGDVQPILEANYLVKGWLASTGLSVVYGASNVGKTFVVLDMAMHIAAGHEWFGNRIAPGPVVYIAAEGGNGIKNRLAAMLKDRRGLSGADFYLLPFRLDMNGDIDPKALCEAIGDLKPSLIVIDTLARSMGDGNENSTPDMNRFIAAVDAVRESTRSHVLVVHHSGKDEERGARGSNALRAAADTEISVTNQGEIRCTKQRDYVTPETLYFTLRNVTLGEDEDGDAVSSAVVDNEQAKPKKRKPLSGKDQVAMNALNEALRDHGKRYAGSDHYPDSTDIVDVSAWREACHKHGLTTGGSDSAARMAFKRAKDSLMNADLIREYNDRVWRVFDDE